MFAMNGLQLLIVCGIFSAVRGVKYQMYLKDKELFHSCKGIRMKDMQRAFDLSAFKYQMIGKLMRIEGSIKVIWANVQPDDRVDIIVNGYLRDEKGRWEPLPPHWVKKNICDIFFKGNDPFFTRFTQFIRKEDQQCLTNKGVVWHLQPFNIDIVLDLDMEMDLKEIEYKMQIFLIPYDENVNKRAYSQLCSLTYFKGIRIDEKMRLPVEEKASKTEF